LPSYDEEVHEETHAHEPETLQVVDPVAIAFTETQEADVPFTMAAASAVLAKVYPEHDKIAASVDQYATIEKFMSHLGNQGIFLAEVAARNDRQPGTLKYSRTSLDHHIKSFLGVNLPALASEKQEILLEAAKG
jgi:hypothetical protein